VFFAFCLFFSVSHHMLGEFHFPRLSVFFAYSKSDSVCVSFSMFLVF
jgi:hypothetical protein